MKSVLVRYIAIIFLLFFASCSKSNIIYSQDYLISVEAQGVVEEIRIAYQDKKRDFLSKNLSPSLSREIGLEFDKADLSFDYKLIKIEGERISMKLTWHAECTVNGEKYDREGSALFILTGRPMKLLDIKGENPFICHRVMERSYLGS
ncbi:MAG: hypothetical protein D6828_01980 [Nitrospirae bacterium]|nr:MAG: hypothetical protein D6828_01980 [Nitrospirota bacterium]